MALYNIIGHTVCKRGKYERVEQLPSVVRVTAKSTAQARTIALHRWGRQRRLRKRMFDPKCEVIISDISEV